MQGKFLQTQKLVYLSRKSVYIYIYTYYEKIYYIYIHIFHRILTNSAEESEFFRAPEFLHPNILPNLPNCHERHTVSYNPSYAPVQASMVRCPTFFSQCQCHAPVMQRQLSEGKVVPSYYFNLLEKYRLRTIFKEKHMAMEHPPSFECIC